MTMWCSEQKGNSIQLGRRERVLSDQADSRLEDSLALQYCTKEVTFPSRRSTANRLYGLRTVLDGIVQQLGKVFL